MLTQPAGHTGCENAEIRVRWVSNGKLNVGCWQGDGHTPCVTVCSSSSKKVKVTVGSEVLHFPTAKPSRSARPPLIAEDPADPRHTMKADVTAGAASNQRAAYLRPRGSRWSPPPQS